MRILIRSCHSARCTWVTLSKMPLIISEQSTLICWQVKVSHFLGIYHYTSTLNGICYVRHSFIAEPVNLVANAKLDPEIQEVVWLSADEIKALTGELRSPVVFRVISDYLQDVRYPLSLITGDNLYG